MKPFNLQEALEGKPFGRMDNGKFIKATKIHVPPDWCDYAWPIAVLFENGALEHFTKNTKALCMQPEETVYYSNVYEDHIGVPYKYFVDCKEATSNTDRIAIQKTTIIGKEVKTEIIPC